MGRPADRRRAKARGSLRFTAAQEQAFAFLRVPYLSSLGSLGLDPVACARCLELEASLFGRVVHGGPAHTSVREPCCRCSWLRGAGMAQIFAWAAQGAKGSGTGRRLRAKAEQAPHSLLGALAAFGDRHQPFRKWLAWAARETQEPVTLANGDTVRNLSDTRTTVDVEVRRGQEWKRESVARRELSKRRCSK